MLPILAPVVVLMCVSERYHPHTYAPVDFLSPIADSGATIDASPYVGTWEGAQIIGSGVPDTPNSGFAVAPGRIVVRIASSGPNQLTIVQTFQNDRMLELEGHLSGVGGEVFLSYFDTRHRERPSWRIARLLDQGQGRQVMWKDVEPWALRSLVDSGQIKGEFGDVALTGDLDLWVDEDEDGTREFVQTHLAMFDRTIWVLNKQ